MDIAIIFGNLLIDSSPVLCGAASSIPDTRLGYPVILFSFT